MFIMSTSSSLVDFETRSLLSILYKQAQIVFLDNNNNNNEVNRVLRVCKIIHLKHFQLDL